jgi:hypothetical protein
MPFISDQQVRAIQSKFSNMSNKLVKRESEQINRVRETRMIGGAVGAAAVLGFARGKLEDASGVWNVPLVDFDAELVSGFSLLAVGLLAKKFAFREDALNMSTGILSHYIGQIARKTAKTSKFTMVAGNHEVGALPRYGSPYVGTNNDDSVAAALANSGL